MLMVEIGKFIFSIVGFLWSGLLVIKSIFRVFEVLKDITSIGQFLRLQAYLLVKYFFKNRALLTMYNNRESLGRKAFENTTSLNETHPQDTVEMLRLPDFPQKLYIELALTHTRPFMKLKNWIIINE